MYQEHPQTPEPSTLLWRYMDLSKFVALLHRKSLFFCRADRLGDAWEGGTSYANAAFRLVQYAQLGKDHQRLAEAGAIGDFYRSTRKHTYISCWHKNSHESVAMWGLYLKSEEGIAIQTTVGHLKQSVQGSETDIIIGSVYYYDPLMELVSDGNTLCPYFRKRLSFSHENEVRAVIQDDPPLGFDRSEPVDKYGRSVAVDVDKLADNVYCAPTSPSWFVDVVQSIVDRFNLKRKVIRSSLSTDPVF